MERTWVVVLMADCDPDRPPFGGRGEETPLAWRGIEEGIPRFERMRRQLESRFGVPIRVTWFVRSDARVAAAAEGEAGACLDRFWTTWDRLAAAGDEIGWHPHLWRRGGGGWIQETRDPTWMRRCYEDGLAAFRDRGRPVVSMHGGNAFQNGVTLDVAAAGGILADTSAIPGYRTLPARGEVIDGADWEISPPDPYFPSSVDYRRPTREEECSLPILEIPVSTLPSVWLGRVYARRHARKQPSGIATGAPIPPAIHLPPTSLPVLFRRLVQRRLDPVVRYLACYFHCDELLPFRPVRSPQRWVYRLGHFRRNLTALVRAARRRGVGIEFSTVDAYRIRFAATRTDLEPA